MIATGSAEFAAALKRSHKRKTIVTITPPGGSAVVLPWSACTVRFSGAKIRRTADLVVPPQPGTDLNALVAIPGSIFTIDHGIDYGGGNEELFRIFWGEVARSPQTDVFGGAIRLDLSDMWVRVERARFKQPYAPGAGNRSQLIADAITAAVPTASVDQQATGGTYTAGGVWERDRSKFITDLANDGELDVYMNTHGNGIIRPEPVLDIASPDWTYRTGEGFGNIKTAARETPGGRFYNTVVVLPQVETQTWSQVEVTLSDPNHPLHPSKYGESPYFYSSPTLMTGAAAEAAGGTILQRLVRLNNVISLTAIGHPGQESGDTIAAAFSATATDDGTAENQLVDSGSLDCKTGDMSVQTLSADIPDVEAA